MTSYHALPLKKGRGHVRQQIVFMKARLGFPWKCFLPPIFHFQHEQFQIYLLNEQYCECLLCANTEIDSEGIKERETKITSSNNKKK